MIIYENFKHRIIIFIEFDFHFNFSYNSVKLTLDTLTNALKRKLVSDIKVTAISDICFVHCIFLERKKVIGR